MPVVNIYQGRVVQIRNVFVPKRTESRAIAHLREKEAYQEVTRAIHRFEYGG